MATKETIQALSMDKLKVESKPLFTPPMEFVAGGKLLFN
jgi:hypothetical protein